MNNIFFFLNIKLQQISYPIILNRVMHWVCYVGDSVTG